MADMTDDDNQFESRSVAITAAIGTVLLLIIAWYVGAFTIADVAE